MMQQNLKLTVCDADVSLINADLEDSFIANYKPHILPYCLAGKTGEAEFYLTRDRAASSLYRMNTYYANWIMPNGQKWKDVCEVEDVVKVHTDTVDDIFSNEPINIISLDAQGAELDILKGAKVALNDSLVAVLIEVEMKRLYEGQALRKECDEFMAGYDFVPIFLYNPQTWVSPKGKYVLVVGECLYLRKDSYYSKDSKNWHDMVGISMLNLVRVSLGFSPCD